MPKSLSSTLGRKGDPYQWDEVCLDLGDSLGYVKGKYQFNNRTGERTGLLSRDDTGAVQNTNNLQGATEWQIVEDCLCDCDTICGNVLVNCDNECISLKCVGAPCP